MERIPDSLKVFSVWKERKENLKNADRLAHCAGALGLLTFAYLGLLEFTDPLQVPNSSRQPSVSPVLNLREISGLPSFEATEHILPLETEEP